MYLDTDFPPGVRLAQFMRVASDLNPTEIGFAIDTLIARLDEAAGDPDLEDGYLVEGHVWPKSHPLHGRAIVFSEDHEPSGDELDASFPEWKPLGRCRATTFAFGMETALNHEDAEDCDPGEDVGDAEDANGAEDDFMQHDADGPGCPVADADGASWQDEMRQPAMFGGGLGGDLSEDAEPWHVAPHWRSQPIPANDEVSA